MLIQYFARGYSYRVLLSLTVFYLSCSLSFADISNQTNTNEINSAGAHFSWVIFNRLKPALEKSKMRTINAHGKNSARGLGSDAAVKNALLYTQQKQRFGFACCDLHPDEINNNNLQVYPLAKEPLFIILNQSNPVNNLSLKQVREIFSGGITNWSEVGGHDKPIVVVTRLHCKKRPEHWKTILPQAKEFRVERLNVHGAEDMIRTVHDMDDAIGHLGSTWTFTTADRIKPITIDNVKPTAKNIELGKYPFYRTLSAVTKKGVGGEAIKLIKEIQQSKTFHDIASEYELLPMNSKK